MNRRREFILAASSLNGLSAVFTQLTAAYGQQADMPPLARRNEDRSPFRIQSTQIVIPFSAVDKHDRLVSGLCSEDLRLLADGREQHIDFLYAEEGPASVLFVLDISGSMKKPVADVKEALRRVLRAASVDDEFALIEFSDEPQLTISFTTEESRVEARVEEIVPAGRTSLTDAIVLGFREMARCRQARKALIVLSDGQENHSRYERKEAMRLALETDVRVYGIELYPPVGEGFVAATFLELLARATGGRYLPTVSRKDIPSVIESIDVHRCYVLGFTPPTEHHDDSVHHVDLKLKRKLARGRVTLFWKERYLIPRAL